MHMGEMDKEDDNDMEADMAVEHLTKAHEMMMNKDLMEKVHKRAGRKMKALKGLMDKAPKKIKTVEDINEYRNKKYGSKSDESME